MAPFDFEVVIDDFLAGVTVKSLLSGAMILMERATRSLLLQVDGYRKFGEGLNKI